MSAATSPIWMVALTAASALVGSVTWYILPQVAKMGDVKLSRCGSAPTVEGRSADPGPRLDPVVFHRRGKSHWSPGRSSKGGHVMVPSSLARGVEPTRRCPSLRRRDRSVLTDVSVGGGGGAGDGTERAAAESPVSPVSAALGRVGRRWSIAERPVQSSPGCAHLSCERRSPWVTPWAASRR